MIEDDPQVGENEQLTLSAQVDTNHVIEAGQEALEAFEDGHNQRAYDELAEAKAAIERAMATVENMNDNG